MKHLFTIIFLMCNFYTYSQYIAEYDYDQPGTDSGENIKIFIPTGSNVTDFQILLYNGSGGALYNTILGSSLVCTAVSGGEICIWDPSGSDNIQNGAPDGIVLYNSATMTVVQGISYEGDFSPVGGPASGFDLTAVSVSENNNAPNLFTVYNPSTMTWSLASPLPVKFGDISVESKERSNAVIFSTYSEKNNDYFELERSSNGQTFEPLSKIQSVGDSDEMNSYQFIDENPLSSINYYRIKQVDLDGQSAYSNIVSTKSKANISISVSNENINIDSDAPVVDIMIMNTSGLLVRKIAQVSAQSIYIGDLVAGIYIINVQANGETYSQKVTKQ